MDKLSERPHELTERQRRPYWYAAGLAFSLLMLCVHALAGLNSAGVPDSWRDIYWATMIAHGEQFPLTGPPIYRLLELGPWWFYLLAVPIGLFGRVAAASVFVQLLAGTKYLLAWRLGTRLVDARLGLAFACSLAMAGWSTIPLMFPSHTAMVEATLLLLAGATWRCWLRLSFGNAILLGLAAGACLNAHPTTAGYIVVAGIALLVRHRSWPAFGWLTLAAVLVALMLAPPWFDGTRVEGRPLDAYLGADIAIDVWRRIVALGASAVVGGAWNGFSLMTSWSLTGIRVAWFVYCACVLFAAAGLLLLPRDGARLRSAAGIAAAVFIAQAAFLVVLRPITPMWMLSSLLPPLAVVLGLGWYGWFRADRHAMRVGAMVMLALFAALSIAPFGLYLRDLRSVRVAPGVNPYQNVIERSDRYAFATVPFLPVRRIDRIAPLLCDEAVLHARLAWMVEQTLGTPVRLACGHWPHLRYGGREGPGPHIAGLFARASLASGIAPDRVVAGMALYERVTAIAPAAGGNPTQLRRDQIHPDRAPDLPLTVVFDFDTSGADVPVLTNRFSTAMPMKVRSVMADGRAARLLLDDGGSMLYRCSGCAADASVHWRFELDGVEGNLDLVVLNTAPAGATTTRDD